MTTPPTLQQLAEAAAREFLQLLRAKHHIISPGDDTDELIAIILKHLAPLEAQLVEAKKENDALRSWTGCLCLNHNDKERKTVGCAICLTKERDKARREVERLKESNTDIVDMHRDEFRRIKTLLFPQVDISDQVANEIAGICNRAIACIEQTVPVIVQRDHLTTENQQLKSRVVELEKAVRMSRSILTDPTFESKQQGGWFLLQDTMKQIKLSLDESTSLTHYQELERKEKE